MALHTQLPIYKLAYDLLDLAADLKETKSRGQRLKRTLGSCSGT